MSSLKPEVFKVEVNPKGVPTLVDAIRIRNKTFVIYGSVLKTASLKREWQEDVDHPEEVIRALKDSLVRIDLLKFWQRLPETESKYEYYKEWPQVAAIPISDFKHWWDEQINSNTRRLVKKSAKLGVTVEVVKFQDELVHGIMEIFDESPVRRGKAFRHYGKDYETVRKEMSADLDESIFIVAYYGAELIGFIKLFVTDRYAMITMILDKKAHRDKTPVNGMLAKAVKICAEQRIPFLTYTLWRRGGHAYFQERNGFQKIPVPEYYVPLTIRGQVALHLGLHKGLRNALPEAIKVLLLSMRARWYLSRASRQIPLHRREGSSATSSRS